MAQYRIAAATSDGDIYNFITSFEKANRVFECLADRVYDFEYIRLLEDGFTAREYDCIPEGKAKSFWNDLRGTLHISNKGTSATISAEYVAEVMQIPLSRANSFLWACVHHNLTDRQNGGFVI